MHCGANFVTNCDRSTVILAFVRGWVCEAGYADGLENNFGIHVMCCPQFGRLRVQAGKLGFLVSHQMFFINNGNDTTLSSMHYLEKEKDEVVSI